MRSLVRVGIIGGSGYTGGELLRFLLLHPKVELTHVTSREYAGEYIFRVHPNLRSLTKLQFDKPDISKTTSLCDLVFVATPHGVSSKLTPKILETGLKVIDLSADFRLKDPAGYEKWYGWKHPHPELLKETIYGIPELYRDKIRNARLIACPGCMAVVAILSLAPIFKEKIVEEDRVVVDVKIGSSGAGAKPTRSTHHSERYGVIRPYKPVGHRHTAEIEQELKVISGLNAKVSMSAHAVNIVRGILSTSHTFLTREVSITEIWRIYRSFYKDEPFIRFIKDKKGLYRLPDPKIILGSNFCDIGFELDEHCNRLVVLGAIDNLVRGAAGIAIQNMNILLGFDEKEGLIQPPIHPI